MALPALNIALWWPRRWLQAQDRPREQTGPTLLQSGRKPGGRRASANDYYYRRSSMSSRT